MSRSWPERIRWRLRHHSLELLLGIAGRPVRCTVCGRQLFRAIPVVHRGRLKMIGAGDANVRVAFHSKDCLEFRHLELDRCPAPERPWVH